MINDFEVRAVCFDPGNEVVQQILRVDGAGRDSDDAERRRLPYIMKIHLGSADVKFFVQARDERFEYAAFGFERGDLWQVQFNGAGTDKHFVSAVDQRGCEW